MKEEILQGKYVSFHKLYKYTLRATNKSGEVDRDGDDELLLKVHADGTTALKRKATDKDDITFLQWLDTWNMFEYILLQNPVNTTHVLALRMHLDKVAGINSKLGNFYRYDKHVRIMISKHLADWATNFLTLEAECTMIKRSAKNLNFRPGKPAENKFETPKVGFCYIAHNQGYKNCTKPTCPYSHECQQCGKLHGWPGKNCRVRQPISKPSSSFRSHSQTNMFNNNNHYKAKNNTTTASGKNPNTSN
jgi:hypothetical protein